MGLMPHPEHAVDELTGSVDGLGIFSSMAEAASMPEWPRCPASSRPSRSG